MDPSLALFRMLRTVCLPAIRACLDRQMSPPMPFVEFAAADVLAPLDLTAHRRARAAWADAIEEHAADWSPCSAADLVAQVAVEGINEFIVPITDDNLDALTAMLALDVTPDVKESVLDTVECALDLLDRNEQSAAVALAFAQWAFRHRPWPVM